MWEFYSMPKELKHHGIKGQRWGDRNGPPYPLSSKKHDSVIKRGNDKKSKKQGIAAEAVVLTAYATVIASAVAISKFKEMRTRHNDAKKDKGHEIDSMESLEKRKTLKSSQSINDIAKNVNPEYDENDPSTSTNCPYCTLATELRSRGYDVTARHLSTGDNCFRLYNKTFKTPPPLKWKENDTYSPKSGETEDQYTKRRYSELCANISKFSGPNSRGAIACSIPFMMGHIFNYRVDSRGQVHFIDGQNGNGNAKSNINDLPSSALFDYTRLDNQTLAPGILSTIRTP